MIRLTIAPILLVLMSVPTALAKGPSAQIAISGPGLTEPIVITERRILEQFIPWGDDFLDRRQGVLAAPPTVDRLYQVLFFREDRDGKLHVHYAFQYAPGQPGYIYLPGRGDGWYATNIGTIGRHGLDGQKKYRPQQPRPTMPCSTPHIYRWA